MAEAYSTNIRQRIRRILERLDALDREKSALQAEFDQLQERLQTEERQETTRKAPAASHARFSPEEKIRIFMSLFRGREDVFPKRWDNAKTEKSGYAPACRNEWMKGVCTKPQIKCGECPNQAFIPVNADIARKHLAGDGAGAYVRDHTIGVYPPVTIKSVWAYKTQDNFYEIDNIPFYARGVGYRDCVDVERVDDVLYFKDIVGVSGQSRWDYEEACIAE